MNKKDIEIIFSSDSNYNKLVIEVFYQNKFLFLLNQDNGRENIIIEFPTSNMREDMILREISLTIFEEALLLAKGQLD